MQYVTIELPSKILFSYHFKIEKNDINDAKHMGNERILVLANSIRSSFFNYLSLKENDITNHSGIIIANHTIRYKNEGFIDDEITCHVGVNNVTECSFDLIYHFVKLNNVTMAIVRTGCVYYNYDDKLKQLLPNDFIKVFTN